MNKLQTQLAKDQVKYEQASTALNKFVVAANAKYDGYAYSTGYLGSMLLQMATTRLNKTQFAEFLAALEQDTVKQTA